MEEVQLPENAAPWCGEQLGMGMACYKFDHLDDWEWDLVEDCDEAFGLYGGYCYRNRWDDLGELVENEVKCCPEDIYLMYGVSLS